MRCQYDILIGWEKILRVGWGLKMRKMHEDIIIYEIYYSMIVLNTYFILNNQTTKNKN